MADGVSEDIQARFENWREVGDRMQSYTEWLGDSSLWAMWEVRICDKRHDGACPDIVVKGGAGQVRLHIVWSI